MATWYSDTDVLEAMLDSIRQGATEVWLIEAYSQGDAYSTVLGNKVAEGDAQLTAGSFSASSTAPGGTGYDREMDFNGAAGTATKDSTLHDSPGGAGTGLHIALVSVAGTKVYAVTDETSNQPIVDGNPVTFPAFTLRTLQPTQI